jgi:hypothetical protein
MALDNSVRLFEASGSAQNNQPRTIHRYFAQGDFPEGNYPKPRVGGAVPAAWQVDVENTWPDGSVMAAFVSLPVSIAANGNAVVDFVKDGSPCHLGGAAACQAAGLTKQQMLDFNAGAWGAVLEGTANAVSFAASARTMVGAGAWSYRLRGPVVTQILVEDVSRPSPAYDFGWEYSGGAWQAPSADKFKSVHPLFTLSFYAGWSGVEVEAMAQNPWTTRGQRQVFDLAVKRGSDGATAVYSKTGFELPWGSQFSRYFWDGSAPAAVLVDFNLRYMISTRLLLPYDYTQKAPAQVVNNLIAAYDNRLKTDDPQSCSDAGYCGNWMKYVPTTGGRGDIGPVPQWYMHYLFLMGDTATYNLAVRQTVWQKQVIGNADAGLTMPVLFRELDNSAARDAAPDGQRYYFNYQSDRTTPAWGRVYSVQARPTGQLFGGNGVDAMAAVCSSGPCATSGAGQNKGWTNDLAHTPSVSFIPYMLTGRYSYLQGVLGAGSWGVGVLEPNLYYGNRNQDQGIMAMYSNFRATAWGIRDIHSAAIAAPDSAPEKLYFRDLLRHNDEFYEGVVEVLKGNAGATGSCSVAQTGTATASFAAGGTSVGGCGAGSTSLPNGLVRNFPVCAPITSVSSVTVNGVAKTVGVLGVATGKDWYYTPGHQSLIQAEGAPALTASDTLNVAYGYGARPASNWCQGRGIYMRGMPNPLAIVISAVGSGDGAYMGHSSSTLKGSSVFMTMYILMTLRQIETAGALLAANGRPLFEKANARLATFVLEPAVKPGNNPYFMDSYTIPVTMKTGTVPQSWSEFYGGFFTQIPLGAAVSANDKTISIATHLTRGDITIYHPLILYPALLKLEDEWIQVCAGADGTPNSTLTVCNKGRGMLGTAAASHPASATLVYDRQLWGYTGIDHNYSNLYADAVALFEDLSVPSGTGRKAWERVYGSLTGTDGRNTGIHWMFVPRERITDLKPAAGAGTLSLSWVAPSGAACKVHVGAAEPAASSDSSDSNSTGKGREQSFSASGLPAGKAYYRISCGTARVSGVATIN